MTALLGLLHEALVTAADADPQREAIVSDGRRHTYGELATAAGRVASGLAALGVRRGDRVAIHLENGWPAAVAIHATLLAGGVFVMVSPQTKVDKLTSILADSEATVVIADAHLQAAAFEAKRRLTTLEHVVVAPRPDGGPDAAASISLDELTAGGSAPPAPGTIPLDLAALIYTSGSTGQPKGVMMSHQSMVFAAESISRYLRLGSDDRILDVLPLSFDYGLYQLLMAVRLRAALVLERSFAFPARTLQRIGDEQVTVVPGVPTTFATLLGLKQASAQSFPSVRRVTNTAAALPSPFLPGLRRVFPNALVFSMYGQTECKRVCYLEPERLDAKPTSVGRAIPGTEAVVLDEHGAECAPGQVGILHVRGPHVMLGYWRRPDLTARVLRPGPTPREAMLCTHDYFFRDEDGDLHFVSRSDDVIKSGGQKVSPVEIENVLHALDGVREAAVVGVPDERLGQAVRAYVRLHDGVELTAADVQRACRAHLEPLLVPREVVFVRQMPVTATGKIRTADLLTGAAIADGG